MKLFSALALAASVLIQAGGGPAFAQANNLEESGQLDRRAAPEPVNDKAFDCPAFKAVIAASPDGFSTLRGAVSREDDAMASYPVTSPLFGSCEVLDKKKVSEISYSCQAEKLDLADMKATIESCLGESAQHYAANENPNTPYLRYNVAVAGRQTRVAAIKMAGKVMLVVLNPK